MRIINSPDEMEKMRKGDILVSVATTPSIVPAMRKASAILVSVDATKGIVKLY